MSRPARAQRHLYVVAVCYQLRPDDFAARLQSLAAGSGIVLHGVVVCNNAARASSTLSGEVELLQGSNDLLDFSGYFEGLQRLLARNPMATDSNVLFVNDTLVTKHAARCILGRVLGLDVLMRQLRVPAICGKLDPYRGICMSNPWSGHSKYITTYCFSLNSKALGIMRDLQTTASLEGVLGGISIHDDGWWLQVPSEFREQVRSQLIYSESPFHWPPASTFGAGLLEKKALCVYFEARLSGEIGQGGALVPINSGPRSSTAIYLQEGMSRMSRYFRS